MWQLLLPTALVLTAFSGIGAGLEKAVVTLYPQWVRVLEKDSVTLRCQGTFSPGDNSTKWFHNESLISHQDANYFIQSASIKDSGTYRCQTALSTLSDPVRLDVHMGWLLLQTTKWQFQEEDPIHLRCHSWENKPVHKVTYLQNGKGRKYFHNNSEFLIPKATHKDSGSYFCRGLIGYNNKSSPSLHIIIGARSLAASLPRDGAAHSGLASPQQSSVSHGPTDLGNDSTEVPSSNLTKTLSRGNQTSPSTFPPWHQIIFCLLIGLLFAVDTVLYFSVQRGLQSSVADYEEPDLHWSKELQDK